MKIRTFAVAVLGLAITAQAQSTQPTTSPANEAGVKAALQGYNQAVGKSDLPKILEAIDITDDLQRQALSLAGRLMAARDALYKASVEKYGVEKLDADGATKEVFDQSVPTFPQFPLDEMQIKVTGDTAKLMMPSGEEAPFTLKRMDGTWKIGSDFLPKMTQKQIDEQKMILDAAADAIDTIRDDVAAGHIRSGDEVLLLMQHRTQKAVRNVQMKQFEAQMQEQIKAAATQPGSSAQPGVVVPQDISKP